VAAVAVGLLGLALAVVPLPVRGEERTAVVAVVQKTWTWPGAAQHPYATAHPGFQYVADQNGAPQAQTLVRLGDLGVGSGESIGSLVLTYPASAAADDGAYDPFNNPSVPPGQQAGQVAALDACPVLTPWVEEPPGRPTEATLRVDCELGRAPGRMAVVDGSPVWTFDLTSIAAGWEDDSFANEGVALVPSPTTGGSWSVALQGDKAKAVVRIVEASEPNSTETTATVPSPGSDSGSGSGPVAVTSDPPIPFVSSGASGGVIDAVPPAAAVVSSEPAPTPPTTPDSVILVATSNRQVPAPVWLGLMLLAAVLGLAGTDLWPARETDAELDL
jgi:hypothetical protein